MHRLALRIGCTLAELGERMSAKEFRQWEAFDAMDPIGDERFDVLCAHALMHVASMHAAKGTSLERKAFVIQWWVPVKAQIDLMVRHARETNVGQQAMNIFRGIANRGDSTNNRG